MYLLSELPKSDYKLTQPTLQNSILIGVLSFGLKNDRQSGQEISPKLDLVDWIATQASRPAERCCLSDCSTWAHAVQRGEMPTEEGDRGGRGDRSASHSLLNLQSWLRSWSALASFSRKPPSRLGQIGLAVADDSDYLSGESAQFHPSTFPYQLTFQVTYWHALYVHAHIWPLLIKWS